MTGIRNSNPRVLVSLLVLSGLLAADEIRLVGDESLSGNILSLNGDGTLELASPLASEPIRLKSGAVEEVVFSPQKDGPEKATGRLELINGDLLPVTLTQIDRDHLTVDTEYAGKLIVPRKIVKSLQLGIHQSKMLYSGPQTAEEWNLGGEANPTWRLEDQGLISNGLAHGARNFDLPEKFTIAFTLKWQGDPSFQMSFADPLGAKGKAADRYILQVGINGLEIKREAAQGHRFSTVILSNRTPDEFQDDSVDIQIKVDRKSSHLQLWLNGELEAAGIDPMATPPPDGGITITSEANDGHQVEFRNLRVSDFDDAPERHLAEKRGEGDHDSLISRDEERWGGELLATQQSSQGLVFFFKSDFQPSPLELPESAVSTLFFAEGPAPASEEKHHPYTLILRENGNLKVSSCNFSETQVLVLHPLLGQLALPRSAVSTLKRVQAEE